MDLKQSDIEAKATGNYNIDRLRKWLDFELSGLLLWILSIFAFKIWFYTLSVASVAALAIIPLLIYTLLEEKRYGWLISFLIFIAVPPFVVYLILDNAIRTYITSMICLGSFYFYCCFLRLAIPEW